MNLEFPPKPVNGYQLCGTLTRDYLQVSTESLPIGPMITKGREEGGLVPANRMLCGQ